MINFFTYLFTADAVEIQNQKTRTAYGNFTAIIGIIVNIILFIGKFIVGTLAVSVSIRADAINNLSDAGSSIISLISFKISSRPADREHPFGHARIEYVAALLVSFFIMHVAVELITDSVSRILRPEDTVFSMVSVIVLSISIAAKIWLYIMNRRIGRKINSAVMGAAASDSLSDVIATTGVLISAVITKVLSIPTDGYIGLIVAVLIFISGLKILGGAANSLLGSPPDPDMIRQITEYVKKQDEVLGIHDIVIHNYGPGRCFASLHVEVDGKKNIFHTHDVIDNIERELSAIYKIHCAVHLDPIVTDNELVGSLRDQVRDIIHAYDKDLTIHDFRMISGPTHSNLIFDLLIPFEKRTPVPEIKAEIEKRIRDINKNYYAVITIDKG